VGVPDADGTGGPICFPVPAVDAINWVADGTVHDMVRVVDATGRTVREQRTSDHTLNIASLKEGIYTLTLLRHGRVLRRESFSKSDH
jgi:hypothetical protein